MSRTTDLKLQSQTFWDLNPCGSSESWEQARKIRYHFTDAYLIPHLEGSLLERKHVLELGCGQGLDAATIVQRSASYAGIDMSRNSLKIARQEVSTRKPAGTPASFVLGDAESLCFHNQTFDAVYSIGVLHHTPGFDAALGEVYRVLKPRGTFIVMLYRTFTPLWAVLRIIRGFLRIPLLGRYVQRRALQHLRDKTASAGSYTGTALLELIGCPVIETYTLSDLRRRFQNRFQIVHSECHRVGFEQVVRLLPPKLRRWWPQTLMEKLDGGVRDWLGFYLLVIAEKVG